MKRFYYNINSDVQVKLTPLGHDIYQKFWTEALKGSNGLAAPELHTDEEGWTTFQMWDLMCIFGCHLYNGCKNPFETNIRFRRDDFATTKSKDKIKK